MSRSAPHFAASLVRDLDEPVRRFFTHTIRDGATLAGGVRLTMAGRVKAGAWLPFTAEQTVDGRSFAWRARVGWGPVTPLQVLDRYGVEWRAESDEEIVARFDLPPEQPEVRARIAASGALQTVSAMRWGNPDGQAFAYVPCGCEVHAERAFGALQVPSRLSVGWWFGTPRHAPFFEAEIRSAGPG